MAYTDDQWAFYVTGALPNGEVWSNTWGAIDTVGGQDPQDFIDLLHQFYDDVITAGDYNATVTATRCVAKNLGTGDRTEGDWASIDGGTSTTQLPTDNAPRISLSTSGTARGGCFLPAPNAGACDTTGNLDAGFVGTVTTALTDFNTAVVAAGWLIAIDRPTTSVMVAASKGRFGHVCDVIRRRRNKIAESYVTVNIGEQVPEFRPGKPYRFLRRTSAYTPGAGPVSIAWSAADEDGDWTGSGLTTTVVGKSGLYIVTCSLVMGAGSSSSAVRLTLLVNGVIAAASMSDNRTAAGDTSAAFMRELLVGDAVVAQVTTEAHRQLLVDGSGLQLCRIGPVRWT